MTLPCFHCDKELESALPADNNGVEIPNQPYAGTIFEAEGHYGSTVFDGEIGHLEINICDSCLRETAKKNKILHVEKKYIRPEYTYKNWVPYER
jgi:hypothetical protein